MAKAAGGNSRQPKSPVPPPTGQRTGAKRFVRESWAELRKVQWPNRQHVAQGTMVVIIIAAVITAYITLVDFVAVTLVDQLNGFLTK